MKTQLRSLTAVVFLVIGGFVSSFYIFAKSGFVEVRAHSFTSSAFVQTAQGANLDASAVVGVKTTAFSSLNSISDVDQNTTSSASYPSGAVRAF